MTYPNTTQREIRFRDKVKKAAPEIGLIEMTPLHDQILVGICPQGVSSCDRNVPNVEVNHMIPKSFVLKDDFERSTTAFRESFWNLWAFQELLEKKENHKLRSRTYFSPGIGSGTLRFPHGKPENDSPCSGG